MNKINNHSLKTGLSFGLTSGIITTLGLMVGLNSASGSKEVVIGGILIIAIADAFSDALGIHMSEESEGVHNSFEIWQSTIYTFFSKFIFASTFIIPIIFLSLSQAIIASIIWGLFLIVVFSWYIGRGENQNTFSIITEHFIVVLVVIFLTNYIGQFIRTLFKG